MVVPDRGARALLWWMELTRIRECRRYDRSRAHCAPESRTVRRARERSPSFHLSGRRRWRSGLILVANWQYCNN